MIVVVMGVVVEVVVVVSVVCVALAHMVEPFFYNLHSVWCRWLYWPWWVVPRVVLVYIYL